ncbi:MAG: hypothetical protein JNK23_23015 [Opitutaceae bacterium]|nr:hypothetical protein [Opitutaceae bacterium]
MDDNAPKENPPADFNKLDLTQLQGFSFGTQWTQEKPSAPGSRREGDSRDDRPRRDGAGADKRDRRAFRRPAGPGGEGGGPVDPSGERRAPREGGGDYRGGPRREGGYGGGGGGDRGSRAPYGGGHGGSGGYQGRGAPQDRGPYDSPYYATTFYPEDTSFNTLVQTIRKSCRTVELFEIARTVVAKTDRFVVVVAHKPRGGADAGDRAASAEPASRPVFHISVPDGLPFESDDAAVAHVLSKHLDKFFDTSEVEVEPPKGNFQVINRCGVTGELLGPPNYHRYNQIVQQHYTATLASRMGPEAFRSRIETVRDPEVVNQWLAKMKKTTRYTWKLAAAKPAAAPDSEAAPAADPAPAGDPSAAAPVAEAPATPPAPAFDALEDARVFLLTQARDKVVRTSDTARFHGKVAETMPPGEIRHAVEGALERQRRFPLDTANALRGRLRREHFTIFKKGSKGVSYVCAVKRKFRVPGQTFADSIGALISFIEANPMVRASELAPKFLGLVFAPAPKPAETTPPLPAEGEVSTAPAGEAPKAEPSLSIDDRARLARMQGDLVWLVREGYVTEFIDGRLFAPPPMVEARKKEIESEEHDPENFPEAPVSEAEPAPAATAESPAPSTESSVPAAEATPAEEKPVDPAPAS